MKLRKEEGFTLVELMVVVLIIGILVAIAIPVFNAVKGRAEQRSCFANQRTVDGAISTWESDAVGNNRTNLTSSNDLVDSTGASLLQAPPVCPTNGVGPYAIAAGTVTGCPDDAATGHGRYQ